MRNASGFACLEAMESRLLLSVAINGDCDNDGDVDAVDLAAVALNWNPAGTDKLWEHGDFDGNGNVDSIDLASIGMNWDPAGGIQAGTEVSWVIEGDVLRVMGTNEADAITLSTAGGQTVLYANGGTEYIVGSFTSREVYGFGGNDTLITISGIADHVIGGPGVDSLWIDSMDTYQDQWSSNDLRWYLHIVDEFYTPSGAEQPTMELAGQDMPDPSASVPYVDFAGTPLFTDSPTYDDVRQGYLNDCFYHAAVGSVAHTDPDIIEQLIVPLGDGTFAVRFFWAGNRSYTLRIDAELPSTGSSPYYGRLTPDGELWVALTEKAYAQFYRGANSYGILDYGWMTDVYLAVTGGIGANIDLRNPWGGYEPPEQRASRYAYWLPILADLVAEGQAISGGTYDTSSFPIIANHAYIVLDIEHVVDDEYIVTVYNVWGYDYYNWDTEPNDGVLEISGDIFMDSFYKLCYGTSIGDRS